MSEQLSKADNDKKWAAGTSVAAALLLTLLKIVVAFATGSLGILAEAAHSALDLVAAVMTFFAIRVSSRPADHTHLYGHGKVENLSALVETLLLVVTCGWIFYGAYERVVAGKVDVEINAWAFGVMFASIMIDYSRSRMLYRAAKEHKSHALEADALHFRTDIWSSCAVILGLAAVVTGEAFPEYSFLRYGDVVSAVLVGLIVVVVSAELGWRTLLELLDTAPPGVAEQINEVLRAMPGVTDPHHIRIRSVGPQVFIELHVRVDGEQTLTEAHDLTTGVEQAIRAVVPGADVIVHPEPIKAAALS